MLDAQVTGCIGLICISLWRENAYYTMFAHSIGISKNYIKLGLNAYDALPFHTWLNYCISAICIVWFNDCWYYCSTSEKYQIWFAFDTQVHVVALFDVTWPHAISNKKNFSKHYFMLDFFLMTSRSFILHCLLESLLLF